LFDGVKRVKWLLLNRETTRNDEKVRQVCERDSGARAAAEARGNHKNGLTVPTLEHELGPSVVRSRLVQKKDAIEVIQADFRQMKKEVQADMKLKCKTSTSKKFA
jgi:hypothetical protein